MKAFENVKSDWKNNPPTYENLCDKSTMEWSMAEEIKNVKNELQNLVELSEKIHTHLVNGLQNKQLSSWEDVAKILVDWSREMEEKMENIIDKFY